MNITEIQPTEHVISLRFADGLKIGSIETKLVNQDQDQDQDPDRSVRDWDFGGLIAFVLENSEQFNIQPKDDTNNPVEGWVSKTKAIARRRRNRDVRDVREL